MPLKINGQTNGSVTLVASSTGTDVTLNLPSSNGTVATTTNSYTYSGSFPSNRNAIVNGNFSIWQRGTSFANPQNTYTADRWLASMVTAATVSRQTAQNSDLPFIQYCARYQRTNGSTSTNNLNFAQSIETVNSIRFAGKTITLSFYARCGTISNGFNSLKAELVSGTGTDQNHYTNGFTGSVTVISQTATLTTSWQRFSYTATLNSNITQIGINFNLTPSGTAGANDWYEITGVQLEANSVATEFETEDVENTLRKCLRYYQRITSPGDWFIFMSGVITSSTEGFYYYRTITPMRGTITTTFSSISHFRHYPSYVAATGTPTIRWNSTWDTASFAIVGSGLTAGQGSTLVPLIAQTNPYPYIEFSAEI